MDILAKSKKRKSNSKKTGVRSTKKVSKRENTIQKKPLQKRLIWISYVLAVCIVLVVIVLLGRSSPETPGQDAVAMDLYVMSQCPFGVQVENELPPLKSLLGDMLAVNIDFIANEQGDSFGSLHGESEVIGDKIQLCAKKHYQKHYIDFIHCQNQKDLSDLKSSIAACAEEFGLDASVLVNCYQGEEGNELLKLSIANSKNIGASASPTIYIAGEAYQGPRDHISLARAICKHLKEYEGCASLPICVLDTDCVDEPEKIGVCENSGTSEAKCTYKTPEPLQIQVLNSPRCTNCDTKKFESVLRQLFKGAKIEQINVDDAEGKVLAEQLGVKKLPVFYLQGDLQKTYAFKTNPQLPGAFIPLAEGFQLRDEVVKPTYFISDEDRKEHLQTLGITLGDNKPQIDFFIMSYCPYGNQAEEAIAPVYEKLAGLVNFNPQYVIYSNYKGGGEQFCIDEQSVLCSMHGAVELNQDIREVCVKKYFGERAFFSFALAMNKACDYKNADTCWVDVAKGLGLDTQKIQTCFANEALTIGAEELRLTKAFGVSGSPSVFIDGEPYRGARTSTAYMRAICAAFDEAPAECDDLPEETQKAPVAPGACG